MSLSPIRGSCNFGGILLIYFVGWVDFLDLPKTVLGSFLNPKIFDMYASCYTKWAKNSIELVYHDPGSQVDH